MKNGKITHSFSFCIASDGPHPGRGDKFVGITILVSWPNLLCGLQLYWETIPGPEFHYLHC